jgi:hypothetical protein
MARAVYYTHQYTAYGLKPSYTRGNFERINTLARIDCLAAQKFISTKRQLPLTGIAAQSALSEKSNRSNFV